MSDPFVGKVIDGRYEILARIGEGGMGVVYKARQTSIDRLIAIKMLNAQMASEPTWVQRFYNEARACARLQHPNTIRMFDFGQAPDGRLFMTMEFLDGISLREALAKGPMAPQRVAKILIQCCASLAEAHSIGIIHRDIKPDNVFLLSMAGSPDFVKLLDFSVAKLLESDRMKTQAGVVFGTPQYMSPEQGRGLPLDARSDLYALGILAFEMLTGNVPFSDENPMTVIQMHLHAAVPPVAQSIPQSVQAILRRALEKDPSRRYQSSGEMMQHCQQVFAEVSQGGMSIGAGGMPKTMFAPGPPGMPPQGMQGMNAQQHGMQQPGMQQPGMQQPGMQQPGMQQPGMQQPGMQQPGMHPYGMQQPGMQSPGYPPPMAAPSNQKTMLAQPNPFSGGMPGMQQPGMGPGGMQPGPGGFAPAAHNQKTIMASALGAPLGPGQMPGGYPVATNPAQQMPQGPGAGPNKTVMLKPSEGVVSVARTGQAVQPVGVGAVEQGATTLFWIVSLVIGVAVGALAYVIVLQV